MKADKIEKRERNSRPKRLLLLSIMALSFFIFQNARASAGYNSHFGVLVNPYMEDWDKPDKTTKLLKELSVKLVISKLAWKDVEPEKGKFSQKGWTKYDELVNRLTGLGIEVTPFISATPQWAIDPKLSPSNWKGRKFGPPAKNPEDVAAFFTQVVKRYKDKIKFWILYNAPQNRNHWIKPKVLAEMYRQARQVLDKVQPEGKLILSGLEGAKTQGIPYLKKFLKAGGGKYVDIYDFHMILGGDTLSETEFNTIQYKKVLGRYGEGSKSIQYGAFALPSEFTPSENLIGTLKQKGWKPNDYSPMTPEQQAKNLVKIMVLGRSLGVERIYWGRTRDYALASGVAYNKYMKTTEKQRDKTGVLMERTHGIVDFDYKAKPSFSAFKVLIQKLDKADVYRNMNFGENGKGVIFKDGGKFTGIFFTWEKEKTVTFRSSAKDIKVIDLYGKGKETVPVKDGKFQLKISSAPIYVEGDLHDLSIAE